jgi:hypothetical protein
MTSEKDPFPLLYPAIDCFNHRLGAKVTWTMDHGDFTLILEEGIEKGSQIFNNYAPKGNEERKFSLEDSNYMALILIVQQF